MSSLTLRILADPLHAALLLEGTPGSGFESHHYSNAIKDIEFPSSDQRAAAAKIAAREDEALIGPFIATRVAASRTFVTDYIGRPAHIQLASASPRLQALAAAISIIIEPTDANILPNLPADCLCNHAFVLDAHNRALLLAHAEAVGADLDLILIAIDSNLGRVAILIND